MICSLIAGCTDNSSVNVKQVIDRDSRVIVPQSDPSTYHVEKLIDEINRLDEICRGGSDMSSADCIKRNSLFEEAEKLNACWGPLNEISANKRWMKCSDDPAHSPKRQWYAHDINHVNCVESLSPADRIRDLQSQGRTPQVRDLKSGAVEVVNDIGNSQSMVWTFFPTIEACDMSLPKNRMIDRKYE